MYGNLISSVTVGAGGASSIDFTSIPSTYTDLVLVFSLRGSAAATNQEFSMFLNNNGTGYSFRRLFGSGTTASSDSGSSTAAPQAVGANATASTFSNGIAYFPNYAGSTNKSYSIDQVTENNATAAIQSITAALWSNTAAITQISIQGTTIQQYSTAYLYGLTKGSGGATAA